MSHLSGYDSDAVGFSSVKRGSKSESTNGTQTSEFSESEVASQTSETRDRGSCTGDERSPAPTPPAPPGLNEFLRRVVPAVLTELARDERAPDDDEDEGGALGAKLLHELGVGGDGGGDPTGARAAAWSCCGDTLAIASGVAARLYAAGRRTADLQEPAAITALRWHGAERALLALGTAEGALAARDARGASRPAQPAHPGTRVAALHWAEAPLASLFLEMQIAATGRRRGAADRVLVSAGGDGCVCAWQVNTAADEFRLITRYRVGGSPAPDITCLDFCKPASRAAAPEQFVVGTRCGALFACSVRAGVAGGAGEGAGEEARVVAAAAGGAGAAPVAAVASSARLLAAAAGSHLRLYNADPPLLLDTPHKVICLDECISCVSWLPIAPWAVAVGLAGQGRAGQGGHAGAGELVRVYDVRSERPVPVRGMPVGNGDVTAVAVTQDQTGSCVMAICSNRVSVVRIADDSRTLHAS